MQWITCHSGQLQRTLCEASEGLPLGKKGFRTGLAGWDDLAPGGLFARGAVHELLSAIEGWRAMTLGVVMARGAAEELPIADCRLPIRNREGESDEQALPLPDGLVDKSAQSAHENELRIGNPKSAIGNSPPIRNPKSAIQNSLPLLLFDPDHTLYPPALIPLGIDLARVYLVRPKDRAEGLWAAAEALRCQGVGAVVLPVDGLTRLEARRLQLAAEEGETVGVLLRSAKRGAAIYAAATRWLVGPVPSEKRTVHRWRIQLVHGHGGRVGQAVYVERDRESGDLRTVAPVAHRPGEQKVGPA